MADTSAYLAIFEDIEPAAEGIERLHELGLADESINIISGIPVKGVILGRPAARTNVGRIAMLGAIMGLFLGIFLIWGTPALYPLLVGGQPIYPVPMLWIVMFEMTMLGLMLFAFIGMFVDSGFPSYTPKQYLPEISHGKIGVLFHPPADEEQRYIDVLKQAGAESVEIAEAHHL